MKKAILCVVISLFILLPAFTLAADDESDVILQAQMDATADGKNYHPFWWAIGGVLLPSAGFLIAAPYFDFDVPIAAGISIGAVLTILGYGTGKARVPAARIATVQNEYDDANLSSLYQTEYSKTLTGIQRRKRGNNALIGLGIGAVATYAGITLFIIWNN